MCTCKTAIRRRKQVRNGERQLAKLGRSVRRVPGEYELARREAKKNARTRGR